ncbi:MAG: zinc ribbon domain-containing protein [Saprospiraceae bacterium]
MPLKKDKLGGGTHADGSKSNKFCSKCYANGMVCSPGQI